MKLSFLNEPGFHKIPEGTDLIQVEHTIKENKEMWVVEATVKVRYYDIDGKEVFLYAEVPKNPPSGIIK